MGFEQRTVKATCDIVAKACDHILGCDEDLDAHDARHYMEMALAICMKINARRATKITPEGVENGLKVDMSKAFASFQTEAVGLCRDIFGDRLEPILRDMINSADKEEKYVHPEPKGRM